MRTNPSRDCQGVYDASISSQVFGNCGETGRGSNSYTGNQVFCNGFIEIHADIHTHKYSIQSDVVVHLLFPFQFGILHVLQIGTDSATVAVGGIVTVDGDGFVVLEILVTRGSDGSAQFQRVQPFHIAQEKLLVEVPADTHTPESRPTLVVTEHGGTVRTEGKIKQVLV